MKAWLIIRQLATYKPRKLHGYINNSQGDVLPYDLGTQSVEHCTGVTQVMGSSPVSQLFQLCL